MNVCVSSSDRRDDPAPRTPGDAPFCLVLDPDLTLHSCNQAFASWLGHASPECLRGRPLRETLDAIMRSKLELLHDRLAGGMPLAIELIHLRADGTCALAAYHVFPPGCLDPRQRRIVAFGSDRQAAMDLLDEFLHLKREQEAVLSRTRDLATRLQARNEDLAAISHMIRHDVNNSLNAITLTAALIEATGHTGDFRESTARIQGLCRHIVSQLNGFVALADAIGQAEVARDCELGQMARDIFDMVAARHSGVPHRATLRLDASHAWVAPDHLGQILENLLDNAFKYRDPARPPLELRLTSRRSPGNRVELEVADNGLGIGEDHQGAIFELFRRAAPDASHGHGIGLAIVKRLVEANDGRITLESRPGHGSCFRISLHASPPAISL